MIRRRYLFIEGLVAATVIIVLLLVMIPRFQRAQIAGRATQALRDMAAIVQAIEAYNLEVRGERYLADQGVTLYEERISGLAIEQAMGAQRLITPNSTPTLINRLEEYVRSNDGREFRYKLYVAAKVRNPGGARDGLWVTDSLQNDSPAWLAERMDTMPTPPDAWNMLWREPIPSRYEIADVASRFSIRGSMMHRGWSCFLVAEPASEWVGVYYGPYLHIDMRNLDYEDLYSLYVPYDPTNGVVSHGFTLYDSMQPLSAFSQFAYEKHLEMRRPGSSTASYMPCGDEL